MTVFFINANISHMKSEQNISNIRHTLAHLLASAVLEMYPETKNTIGPAIDDGFYYDFDFSEEIKISEKDLPILEKKMKSNLKHWTKFTHREVDKEEAKEIFKDNQYKLELIE
jgi:threonyl-tRNA synthetase